MAIKGCSGSGKNDEPQNTDTEWASFKTTPSIHKPKLETIVYAENTF
jgi:hypothetical protein